MIYDLMGDGSDIAMDIRGNRMQQYVYDYSGNSIALKDPYIEGRLLLFEDDFSGNALNMENWSYEIGHLRGKAYLTKWPGNVSVQDGILKLSETNEEHFGYTWSEGSIKSRGKKSWTYGRFEAKIKLPVAFNGAFWFMGDYCAELNQYNEGVVDYKPYGGQNEYGLWWSRCGEIDVVESWNYTSKSNPTCNMWKPDGKSIGSKSYPTALNVVDQWHIYAMERTPEYIAMFIDGVEYHRWTFSSYSAEDVAAYVDQPIAIQLGIGLGDENDIQKAQSADMFVDWVRVYAPVGVTEAIPETSITIQEEVTLKKGYCLYLPVIMEPVGVTDRTVTWFSGDPTICSCDERGGIINGVEVGETDVYVTSKNGLRARCHVTVVLPE